MKKNKQDNKKNNVKKITPYLINTLITLTVFLLALFINKVSPFGNMDLASYDAFAQYKPMLYDFIKSIQEGIFSTYSFSNALGNSFFFNYTYYLSSPINFIALLFKDANSMFFAVIATKLIITTITATFYSMKKTENKTISTVIALSYVFSSWFLAYHQSIMWLDTFMIFPLFQYGLEKLMNENKPYVYIFSLAYIMISNFYMAWMICLYTLGYFIFKTIFTKKDISLKLKNFNTIAISTMIVILLSFTYIYITYDSFMNIDLFINAVSDDQTTFTIFNLIESFFSGNKHVTLSRYDETFPNIALNTIFTISLLYYFINNKIDKKERLKNLLVFIFIIVLIYSKTLNYLMNCFHVPIGYNFRYSFLITFYLVHLFIQNYNKFDKKIDKKIYFVNILLLILLVIVFITKNIELNVFLLNIIPLIIYTLYFIFYRNNKIFKYLFLLIVLVEVSISAGLNITPTFKRIEQDITYQTNINNYRELLTFDEENFELFQVTNMNLYNNTNTIPYFSSMQYNQALLDLQILGCLTDNKAMITLCPDNQIFKTVLNIKTNNEYYLEKIFAVNKDVQNLSLNSEDYFENHNILIKGINNTSKDIITKKELKQTKKAKNKYKIEQDGTYYLPLKSIYQVIIVNNNAYTYNKDLVSNENLNIKEIKNSLHLELKLNKKDIIEIIYPSEEDILETLPIYFFDEKEFINIYNDLKEHQIKYTSYKDSSIEGTITLKEDQIIFTSIPYDKNWKVTVDGKEVDKLLILNSLIGIECEPGTHTIKLEYKPNYILPAIISTTTFIGLITFMIIKHKKRND